MIARRQLPHVRLGRRVALLADDLHAYLAAHRVPAEGEPEQAKRTPARRVVR
jgi:hypothetical protein